MNQARQTILGFFKRDIALIRANGTPAVVAELDKIERAINQLAEPAVSFAEGEQPAYAKRIIRGADEGLYVEMSNGQLVEVTDPAIIESDLERASRALAATEAEAAR